MLAFAHKIWHKTAVPIWVERFMLTVLAGAFLGIVLWNTMKLDTSERVCLGIIMVGLSYLVAHEIHKQKSVTSDEIIGKIEWVATGGYSDTPESVQKFLVNAACTIENPHGPSTSLTDWKITIELPDGRISEGSPPIVDRDTITVPLRGYNKKDITVRSADYLPDKTIRAIATGDSVSGWFWGVFGDVNKAEVQNSSAVLVVSFRDIVSGKQHFIRRPFNKPGRVVPGLFGTQK